MRTKGVGFGTQVELFRVAGNDIAVTIHCRDLREDAIEVEKTMTFTEKNNKLFPKDYGDDFMRAYDQIEGWLFFMGVHEACHGAVIDSILKCSDIHPHAHPFISLKLDVFVQLTDVYSIDYLTEDEEEEEPTVPEISICSSY